MCVFQTAIILFCVSIGVKEGRPFRFIFPNMIRMESKPTRPEVRKHWSSNRWLHANPLPHVLMLTAIVVGVATLGLALALCQKFTKATVLWRKTSSWPSSKRRMPPISNPTSVLRAKPRPSPSDRLEPKGVPRIRPERPAVQAKKVRARESPKLPSKAPAKKTPRKAVRKKGGRMMENAIAWILLFPLFGAVAAALFGMGNRKVCWPIGVLCMTGSFVAGVLTLLQAIDSPDHEVSYVFGGWIIDSFPRGWGSSSGRI